MAQRRTPAATTAGILPIAIALLQPHAPTPPPAASLAPATRPPSAEVSKVQPAGIAAIYPNGDLTPGEVNPDVTQDNIAQNICSKDWSTSTIRPPASYTTGLKKSQLPEYNDGVSDPSGTCMANSGNSSCYEEDHLISLENGGNPKDPHNLWPEPYNTMIDGKLVGARQKDIVEGFIHDQICFAVPEPHKKNSHFVPHSGLTLARGQEILAKDWYACYLLIMAGEDCK